MTHQQQPQPKPGMRLVSRGHAPEVGTAAQHPPVTVWTIMWGVTAGILLASGITAVLGFFLFVIVGLGGGFQ